MVKVRIQGLPEEVKQFLENLKAANFEMLNVTDEYKNRGSSKYVRVYADIESTMKRKDDKIGKS